MNITIKEVVEDILEMSDYLSEKGSDVTGCANDILNYFNKNYIPKDLLNNKKFVLSIIGGSITDVEFNIFKNNPYIYPIIGDELKKDKEILFLISLPDKNNNNNIKGIRNDLNKRYGLPNFYQYLPEEVLKDKERVKILWKGNKKYNYDDLPDSLKNDIEVCIEYAASRKDFPRINTFEDNLGDFLHFSKIPDNIIKNKSFIVGYLDRIKDNKEINKLIMSSAEVFTEVFSANKDLKILALTEWIKKLMYLIPKIDLKKVIEETKLNKEKYKELYDFHHDLFSNKNYFIKIVSNIEMDFSISQRDGDFYKDAQFNQIDLLIKSFDKSIINNKDNWLEIIKENPYAYIYMRDYQNKFNEYISVNILKDEDIGREAVKRQVNNIEYAPDIIKKDAKLIEYGLENGDINLSPILIGEVYEHHKENKELITKICIKNPTSIPYLEDRYGKDVEFIYNILINNINIYEFIHEDLKKLGSKQEIKGIMEKYIFKESLEKEIEKKDKVKRKKI